MDLLETVPKSTVKKRHYCCVCSNFRGKVVDDRVVTLHRFPHDESLRKAWIRRIKTVSPLFVYSSNDRLCSFHFLDGTYDKKNPIPVIFNVNGVEKKFKSSKMDSFNEIQEERQPFVQTDLSNDTPDDMSPAIPFRYDSSVVVNEEVSTLFHDYVGKNTFLHLKSLNKVTQTPTWEPKPVIKKQLCDAYTQTEIITQEFETQTPVIEKKSVATQVQRPDIVFEDVKNDSQDVMFYTGIPDAPTFLVLFDEMNDIYRNQDGDSVNGRPRSLRVIDEFFMVLMRLRLGLLIYDLANRFHISKTSCSDIISRWISYLSLKLSYLTAWPSRDVIKQNLPDKFRKYPNCRVIIDCTEIYTETPQSLKNRSLMYSNYKSHMTYKSLIGISPNGVITFVSDLWGGSISDKQLTKACGFLDLLDPGDQLMADKGFLISDLTTERGVQLIVPPLKNKRFMRRDVEETRRIANLRIYVEMAIERVKNFRILQGVMPITLSQQASQIWKICASLCNLQPPLVNRN